jgi:hypothetical protein
MSHIRQPLVWTQGIFDSFNYDEPQSQLNLKLLDGSFRKMNIENWHESIELTHIKLRETKRGTPINIATWGGYDPDAWFCDINPVINPKPLSFLRQLSKKWIIKDDQESKIVNGHGIEIVRCAFITRIRPGVNEFWRRYSYIEIALSASDPFFKGYRASFSWNTANVFADNPMRWYDQSYSGIDDLFDLDIIKSWYSMDTVLFTRFIDKHIVQKDLNLQFKIDQAS